MLGALTIHLLSVYWFFALFVYVAGFLHFILGVLLDIYCCRLIICFVNFGRVYGDDYRSSGVIWAYIVVEVFGVFINVERV